MNRIITEVMCCNVWFV